MSCYGAVMELVVYRLKALVAEAEQKKPVSVAALSIDEIKSRLCKLHTAITSRLPAAVS